MSSTPSEPPHSESVNPDRLGAATTLTTRLRALDAAFDLAAEVGLTSLTLEDVAARAGVSRQTLYRHFGSRDGLLEALVLREEDWFIRRVDSAARPYADAEDAIAAGVAEALRAASEHPLLRRILDTEPGQILPLLVLGQGPVISAARPVFQRLVADRLDSVVPDVVAVADACSRLVISYVLDPGEDPPTVTGRRIARLVVHGISAGAE